MTGDRRTGVHPLEPDAPVLLVALGRSLGGRYSIEMGIDVDRDDEEIERWFLAATLFGHRISAGTVVRTHAVLDRAGVRVIADVASFTWEELVALLDEGGYARYDFSTASRLQALAAAVEHRLKGPVADLGGRVTDPGELEAMLDVLPGWGPTTVRVFLRELRGRWPAACPPLDPRAGWAAGHLGLSLLPHGVGAAEASGRRPASRDPGSGALATLAAMATAAGFDIRDAEAALIRLALAHARRAASCPGGPSCTVVVAQWAHS